MARDFKTVVLPVSAEFSGDVGPSPVAQPPRASAGTAQGTLPFRGGGRVASEELEPPVLAEERLQQVDHKIYALDVYLRQEDQDISREDSRIEEEDEQLRRENDRLRREVLMAADAAKHIESTTTRSGAKTSSGELDGVGVNAMSSADLERERIREVNKRRNSTIHAHGEVDSQEQQQHTRTVLQLTIAGLVAAGGLLTLWVTYRWHQFRRLKAQRLGRPFKDEILGMKADTLRSLIITLTIDVAVFALLWWRGVIQEFLKMSLAIVYVIVVISGFMSLFLAEFWSDISSSIGEVKEVMHKVHRFTGEPG